MSDDNHTGSHKPGKGDVEHSDPPRSRRCSRCGEPLPNHSSECPTSRLK